MFTFMWLWSEFSLHVECQAAFSSLVTSPIISEVESSEEDVERIS